MLKDMSISGDLNYFIPLNSHLLLLHLHLLHLTLHLNTTTLTQYCNPNWFFVIFYFVALIYFTLEYLLHLKILKIGYLKKQNLLINIDYPVYPILYYLNLSNKSNLIFFLKLL